MSKMSLAVAKAPVRAQCPHCTYATDPVSLAAHIDLAHGSPDRVDQAWLDEQVARLGGGLEAARSIWENWFEGRNVGRLHPGKTAGDYIAGLGLRLTLPEAMAALPDASTREVAKVAGVHSSTVVRARAGDADASPVRGADGKEYARRVVTATVIDDAPPPAAKPVNPPSDPAMTGPQEDAPIDPAAWNALLAVLDGIEQLSTTDAAYLAATVPNRRRAATAKRLRKLGTYLGGIAWALEGEDYQP